MITKNLLFFLALLLFTNGIYRDDRPVENYLKLASEERFDCVGEIISLQDGKWQSIGSFVVIDSMTILSAAHCFVVEKKKDTVVNYQGNKLNTFVSAGRGTGDVADFRFFVFNTQLTAKSILIHPRYLQDRSCDIALIKLEKPIHGCPVLKLNELSNEVGDTVTGVGFGVSGPGNRIDLVNAYHIKLAGQNILDSIGGAVWNGMKTMLYADFDSPGSKAGCNKTGSPVPLELEYSIGAGDSGGPLFITKNNELCLAGIACYAPKTITNLLKNGYYCELNGWTRVSAFVGWVKENR